MNNVAVQPWRESLIDSGLLGKSFYSHCKLCNVRFVWKFEGFKIDIVCSKHHWAMYKALQEKGKLDILEGLPFWSIKEEKYNLEGIYALFKNGVRPESIEKMSGIPLEKVYRLLKFKRLLLEILEGKIESARPCFPEFKKKEIITRIRSGEKLKDIASDYSISTAAVSRIKKDAGIPGKNTSKPVILESVSHETPSEIISDEEYAKYRKWEEEFKWSADEVFETD